MQEIISFCDLNTGINVGTNLTVFQAKFQAKRGDRINKVGVVLSL